MKPAAAPKRLGRDDWLDAGLRALRAEGVAGVRVKRLADRLGVTSQSFYWHFESRDALLEQLLTYWQSEMTERVRDQVAAIEGTAAERLLALAETLARSRQGSYDVAIRAWAAFDSRAARVVRAVDKVRYEFVRGLFRDLGLRGEELEARTRLFVVYHSLETAFSLREPAASKAERLGRIHRLLTDVR